MGLVIGDVTSPARGRSAAVASINQQTPTAHHPAVNHQEIRSIQIKRLSCLFARPQGRAFRGPSYQSFSLRSVLVNQLANSKANPIGQRTHDLTMPHPIRSTKCLLTVNHVSMNEDLQLSRLRVTVSSMLPAAENNSRPT